MMIFFITTIVIVLLLIIVFYNKILIKAHKTVNKIIFSLDEQIESYRLVNVDKQNPFYKDIIKERERYYSYKLLIEKCIK
jgi:P pilus assembly chaperone PapD